MGVLLAVLEGVMLLITAAGVIVFLDKRMLDYQEMLSVLPAALAISASSVVSFYYNDLYDLRIARRFGDFPLRLLQAIGGAIALLGCLYFLFPDVTVSRYALLMTMVVIIAFTLMLRAAWYALLMRRPFSDRVLILGTGRLASTLADIIESTPDLRFTVIGCLDDRQVGDSPIANLPVVGSMSRLREHVRQLRPDRIVVALTERRGRLPIRELLAARFDGVMVEDGTDVYERLAGKLAIESMMPSSLIFSSNFRSSRWPRTFQRILSIAAAVIALVISAPLMALLALLIRLESSGPALFVQSRIGLGGRPFRLLKFRTMRVVPEGERSFWVKDNEDRVTRLGRFMRRCRLDELPQFANVLRGDMNLVGPRPQPVENAELFQREIPFYELRSVVRPGITGWAQIRYGYANNLLEETEKMRFDLYYIKRMSVFFDLLILFETFKIVLFGRGAQSATVYEERSAQGEAR